jgi:hypothetical protein
LPEERDLGNMGSTGLMDKSVSAPELEFESIIPVLSTRGGITEKRKLFSKKDTA